MQKEIFIIRHGETELNRQGIVQGCGVDPSLNATGQAQADAFYARYQDVPFELVMTSRLRRSRETVQAFIKKPLPWVEREEINEISWGVHEGKPSEPHMIKAYQRMIGAWAAGDLDARLEQGESAGEMIARIDSFLEELKSRSEKHILVCTHGRALRCMITRIQNDPVAAMETVPHANTGLYQVRWDGRDFHIHQYNDTRHL